jgi:hypothetical protein
MENRNEYPCSKTVISVDELHLLLDRHLARRGRVAHSVSPIPVFIKISLAVTTCWALHNAVNVTKLLRDKQEFEDWERGQKYEARAVSLDAA